MALLFILLAYVTVLAIIAILAIRNRRVYEYRSVLINKIYDRNIEDIDAGRPPSSYKHRRDIYNSVSYEEMTFKFWRKLDSFYDPEFLKELL